MTTWICRRRRAERGRGRGDRRAGRVDVVDEDDPRRRARTAANAPATFRRRSARERPRCGRAWRRASSGSTGRPSERRAPARAPRPDGARARARAPDRPAPGRARRRRAAARAPRRRRRRRRRRGPGGERCFQAPTSARAASSWPRRRGRRRRRAAARRTRAPAHGPRVGRAAALAERRPDPPQAREAGRARGRPVGAADDAALREQEIEHHASDDAPTVTRLCRFVPEMRTATGGRVGHGRTASVVDHVRCFRARPGAEAAATSYGARWMHAVSVTIAAISAAGCHVERRVARREAGRDLVRRSRSSIGIAAPVGVARSTVEVGATT